MDVRSAESLGFFTKARVRVVRDWDRNRGMVSVRMKLVVTFSIRAS